jgi:hypothetical protein
MAEKTGTGATGIDVKKGCSFKKITIRENIDNSNKDIAIDDNTPEYILIAGNSKRISVNAEFENLSECYNGERHGKIEIKQNGRLATVNNGANTEIVYDYANSRWRNYLLLSDSNKKECIVNVDSCRVSKQVLLKVYPDIQWGLAFYFGMENPIAIKWREWKRGDIRYVPPGARSTAGSIGADTRYGKNSSFGFELKGRYNDETREHSFKAEYETRIRQFSGLLEKFKDPLGAIKEKIPGTFPITLEAASPVVSLEAQWQHAKDETSTRIGKKVEVAFKADPIMGIDATVDLLGLGLAAASPGVYKIYTKIRDLMNRSDDNHIKIFIDLIFSGKISGALTAGFTMIEGGNSPAAIEADLDTVISMRLRGGVNVKGTITRLFVKVKVEGKAEISGNAGILFGHQLACKDRKVIYRPKVIFQGLIADYLLYGDVGLAVESFKFEAGFSHQNSLEIIPEIDFIQELERKFNFNADFTVLG